MMEDLLKLEMKPDIWADNECGELKEVVIGRPDQHQFPTLNDMIKERLKVLHSSDRKTPLKFVGNLVIEGGNQSRHRRRASLRSRPSGAGRLAAVTQEV